MKIQNWIKLAAVLAILFLAGCNEEEDKKKIEAIGKLPSVEQPSPSVYQNRAGQFVESVQLADFNSWLSLNRDCEIVSITAISVKIATANPTDGFVIVYKKNRL